MPVCRVPDERMEPLLAVRDARRWLLVRRMCGWNRALTFFQGTAPRSNCEMEPVFGPEVLVTRWAVKEWRWSLLMLPQNKKVSRTNVLFVS